MKDLSPRRIIFVHNAESGTAEVVVTSQLPAQRLDKCGFPRAHLATKEHDTDFAGEIKELPGSVSQFRKVANRYGCLAHRGASTMYGMIISSRLMPPCWKVLR